MTRIVRQMMISTSEMKSVAQIVGPALFFSALIYMGAYASSAIADVKWNCRLRIDAHYHALNQMARCLKLESISADPEVSLECTFQRLHLQYLLRNEHQPFRREPFMLLWITPWTTLQTVLILARNFNHIMSSDHRINLIISLISTTHSIRLRIRHRSVRGLVGR
jgi:hypothetical protein